MPYSVPTLVAFGAAAALAAALDVARRRIPNWVTVPVLAGAVTVNAFSGLAAVGSALGAAALVGALLFPLWRGGRLGGGDLKLAVAAAGWVGLSRLPAYLLASAIAGGAAAVVAWAASAPAARAAILGNLRAAAHGVRLATPANPGAGRVPVPAGAAFAAGALWALLRS